MRLAAIAAIAVVAALLAAACGAGLIACAAMDRQQAPAPAVAIDRVDAAPRELLRDGSVWDSPAWRDRDGHAARPRDARFDAGADGAVRLHAGSLLVAQLPGHAFGRLELALDGVVARGSATVRVSSLVRAIPRLAELDAIGPETAARLAKPLLERRWQSGTAHDGAAGAAAFASGEFAGDPETTWLLVSVEASADGDVEIRRLHLRELVASAPARHSVGAETRAARPVAAGSDAWFPLPPLRASTRVEFAVALPEIAAPATTTVFATWELATPNEASVAPRELTKRDVDPRIARSSGFLEPAPDDASGVAAAARRWREVALDVPSDLPVGAQLHVTVSGKPGQALFVATPRLLAKRDAAMAWNLVLVSLDTLRADRVGRIGADGRSLTPNLDRLAQRCVRFTRATSPANFTVPAHASMMTGLQPAVHGAARVDERVSIGAFPNVAEACATAGMATAAFTGGGFVDAAFGFDRGFDRYGMLDPLMTPRNPRYAKSPRREQPAWNRAVRAGVSLRDATGWIDAHADRRFFLFLHTYHAHDYSPSEATAQARSIALDAPWPAPADLQNEGVTSGLRPRKFN